jgi:hypothetical protein
MLAFEICLGTCEVVTNEVAFKAGLIRVKQTLAKN